MKNKICDLTRKLSDLSSEKDFYESSFNRMRVLVFIEELVVCVSLSLSRASFSGGKADVAARARRPAGPSVKTI